MLLAFLAFQFFSCENEPLTGNFPDPTNQNGAEEGQFMANVAGQQFVAVSANAVLYESNKLEIKGLKGNGESITISVANATVGTFNLKWDGQSSNYASYTDDVPESMAYVSLEAGGGTGELRITELDPVANTVTGTFEFKGVRIKMDSEGNPVLDGNGLPVMESIDVSNGVFNSIAYVPGEGEGDGDGDGDPLPENEFFAKVRDVDFVPDSLSVTEPVNGGIPMIKIEALNSAHELIRLDIPKHLGVGTFDMESISDGTKLIGLYSDNMGGANLTSNPGRIKITEFDLVAGKLVATFNFTATDPLGVDTRSVRIKNGAFTIYFEGVPSATNRLTAKIDGNPYTAETIEISNSVVNQYPRLTLTTVVNNQKIELSFPKTLRPGTYEMGSVVDLGNENVGIFVPMVGTSIQYFSEVGTLVITEHDFQTGIIEGTFEFTAKDTEGQDPTEYEITEGEFMVIAP